MEPILEYVVIDLSVLSHRECLSAIWKDGKDFYCSQYSLKKFLLSFDNEFAMKHERLVKRNGIYIGWIRVTPIENCIEPECILLKKYRNMGFGKEILKDIIDRNKDEDVVLNIKRDNYLAINGIKPFHFFVEKYSEDRMVRYKLSRNSQK